MEGEARRDEWTGRWYWCVRVDRPPARRLGYCAWDGGHATPEGARACYRRYVADREHPVWR